MISHALSCKTAVFSPHGIAKGKGQASHSSSVRTTSCLKVPEKIRSIPEPLPGGSLVFKTGLHSILGVIRERKLYAQ